MALIAKASEGEKKEYAQVPVGMHLARCYKIVDVGTQKKVIKGDTKFQRTIHIYFEVHGEDSEGKKILTSNGEPMSIDEDYNISLNEKSKLTGVLESWRGKKFTEEERKGFDVEKVIGSWAMINVTANVSKTNGKTYHNLTGIMPVPKVYKDKGLPEPFNKNQSFSFDDDKPNMEVFDSLGSYMQNKIKESPEWKKLFGSEDSHNSESSSQDDGFNDDIPF